MPKSADVDENSKGRVQLPQNTIDEMRELAQWQHRTGAQFALVAVKKRSPACGALNCAGRSISAKARTEAMTPHLVTVKELASMLGCSWRHVLSLRDQRLIPYVRLGRLVRYNPEESGRPSRSSLFGSVATNRPRFPVVIAALSTLYDFRPENLPVLPPGL